MQEDNFAGNIIVNLASLPDFLREPILKKRMVEFFTLPQAEQDEIITNALEAGPTIPFPNFAKLLRTWLKILASLPQGQRGGMVMAYASEAAKSPQRLVGFNLDGILEVYLSLGPGERQALAETVRDVVRGLGGEERRRIMIMMPDNAKAHLGL